MTLTFSPLFKSIAVNVQGADLTRALGQDEVQQIERAFHDYNVLVFRKQPLDDAMQQQFIQSFGPPVITGAIKELARKHNHNPHLLDISTIDEEGKPIAEGSFVHLYNLANQLWHTDGSFSRPATRLTALSARQLPGNPPPTEYANMRGAWEALSAQMKEKVEKLVVEHSIVYSRSLLGLGNEAFSPESQKAKPPVNHPLVRRHPVTGRKSLYLSSHASHIVGWPVDEGRALLRELTEHATQAEFVYSHQWETGDLVMWDNTCSMHRATPYKGSEPRMLRWSAVRELEAA